MTSTGRWRICKKLNWSFNLRALSEIHLNCHPELKSRFRNIRLLAIAGLIGLISTLMNHLALFIGQQLKQQRRRNTLRSLGASFSYLFTKNFLDLLFPLVFGLAGVVFLIYFLFPYYQSFVQWQGSGTNENYISKHDFKTLIDMAFKWSRIVFVLFLLTGSLIISGLLRKAGKQTPFRLFTGFYWEFLPFCRPFVIQTISFHAKHGQITSVQARRVPFPPYYADIISQIPGVKNMLPISDNFFLKD